MPEPSRCPPPQGRTGGLEDAVLTAGRHALLYRMLWGGAVLLVLWWTLLPFASDLSTEGLARAIADIQWIPFLERGRPPLWSDILGNVALFAPFGFLGWRSLEGRRHRLVLLLAAAAILSLGVEVAQLCLPARRTSATDLVTDVIGAGVGAALGFLWERRGRGHFIAWLAELARGNPGHVLVMLFAACLLVWALLPGTGPAAGLWRQTQGYSSSFRRFPGWHAWFTSSIHPFSLGWLFAALASRSASGRRRKRVAFGMLAAFTLGLGLETSQLLSPSRRPEIFQALAFGLGGVPGALAGVLSGPLATACCLAILVAALSVPLGADSPPGVTGAALLLGGLLVGWAAGVPEPKKGRAVPTGKGDDSGGIEE